ncbi:MAG: leucine-rich repeat domain-containing protein, partial [Clostridia bacterium]
YLTKTNPLLKQLEIEVAGRGFEKIVNNKIFNPDDFVIENGVLTEYKGKGGVVVLPDNVESVGEKVFSGNKDILKLVADDCLVRIKPYAFEMCQNLQEVFLAPAVVSLEESSFYNCNVLEKVVMGDGLKSIGKYAFAKCPNLKEVSVAEGLSEIGDKAFFLDDNLSKSIRKTIKKINKDALR